MIFAQMVDDPSTYVDDLRSDSKLVRKAESALKFRVKLWKEARALAEKAKGSGLPVQEPGAMPTLSDTLCDAERQRLFRIIEELVVWRTLPTKRCCGQRAMRSGRAGAARAL